MTSASDIVERLADALDRDDYGAAKTVMADRVRYSIGEQVLEGPEEVVQSYRTASETAHRVFDRVEYGHDVLSTDDPHTFRVSYSDELTVAGETLTHMAEQQVTVDPEQGVIGIVNVDVPGEREKVEAFLHRHNLSRDG